MEVLSRCKEIILRGLVLGVLGNTLVFVVGYVFPPQGFVSERLLRSGIVIENSICRQKVVAVGGASCRTRIRWYNGEEEIVDLPFPLFKGEGIEMVERTIHPPYLPLLREVYYVKD